MPILASSTLIGSQATVTIQDASATAVDFSERINSVTLTMTPNTEDDSALTTGYTSTKAHSGTLTLEIEFKGTDANYDFCNIWATTLNEGREVVYRPGGEGTGKPQWTVIAHSGTTPNTATREALQMFSVQFECNPPASGNPYSTQ